MIVSKSVQVLISNEIYDYQWQDHSTFFRLNIFKDHKKIGFQDIPVRVDRGINMVKYLIKRTVGWNLK